VEIKPAEREAATIGPGTEFKAMSNRHTPLLPTEAEAMCDQSKHNSPGQLLMQTCKTS
jgi:hypothetical protein